MTQLILHLIGDYITQSDWMAQNKTKSTWAAFYHATIYSIPFAFIASWPAWLVIWSTHLVIDRYRLARYVVWLKNFIAPFPIFGEPQYMDYKSDEDHSEALVKYNAFWDRYGWENCKGTGYPSDSPPWMAVWLLIAADNTIHLAINAAAIAWL